MRDLGAKYKLRVWTDSTASIGICSRQGIGKIRHLETRLMWIQQRIRNEEMDLCWLPGDKKSADVFTKPTITAEKSDEIMEQLSCKFVGGRPKTAPTLRKEGGSKVFSICAPAHDVVNTKNQKSKVRWADTDDEPLTKEQLNDADAVLRGKFHKATPVEELPETPEPMDSVMEYGRRLCERDNGRTPLFET